MANTQNQPEAGKPVETPSGRDIVVIGGSAGGIEPLRQLVEALPAELPAAVFVVIHGGPGSQAYLRDILSKHAPMRVLYPADHEPIELGSIYLAPPDRHLLVKAGEVRVILGPRENNFRPAIDPLFRTAAFSYGPRVIGVVLSGMLDDGSHGLMLIKQRGGVALAQSPDEAAEPSMPLWAIERAQVNHIAPAAELGRMIIKLAGEAAWAEGPQANQLDMAEGLASGMRVPGRQACAPYTCPSCGGSLWQLDDGPMIRFRCHVGHGFTADTLLLLQDDEIEQSLWCAVRVLDEQAELQKSMADKQPPAMETMRQRFRSKARERQHLADVLRSLLTGRAPQALPSNSPLVRDEYTRKRP